MRAINDATPLDAPYAIPFPRLLSLPQIASTDRFDLETMCRAQAQPVYLGDDTALCRMLGRYKFYVDTKDRGFGANVLLDGFWEMWLTQFITRLITPGMLVFDIGANFGYYTLLLADLVGPDGRVYAIEPNPKTAVYLRNSVMLNGFGGRTRVIEAAAGAIDAGEVQLHAPHGEPKNSYVVPRPGMPVLPGGSDYTVSEITIDGIVAQSGRIDFVKIDAEGAEEQIVEGMRACLQRHKPMLVLEFNALRGTNAAALIEKLVSIYGKVQFIDYYGHAIEIDAARVMSEHPGEDWLLFFR